MAQTSSRRGGFILLLLAWIPAMAYGAILGHSMWRTKTLDFERIDFCVLALVLAHTAGTALFARSAQALGRWVLATWSVVLTLAAAEGFLRMTSTPETPGLPCRPGRWDFTVGTDLPGLGGPTALTVNRLGLRGPETSFDTAELRVLCVGGSTTECEYVTDEASWPWIVGEELQRRSGRKVFVGNAGRAGHIALHHAHLIRNYAHVPRFHWVVVLAGINDLGMLLRGTAAERRVRVPAETLTLSLESKFPYRRLSLLRLVTSSLTFSEDEVVPDLAGQWIVSMRKNRAAKLRTHPESAPPPATEAALATWRSDLRSIIEATRARGPRLVMMTQPVLYAPGLSPELEAILWEHTSRGAFTTEVLAGLMDRFNTAMKEVCAAEAVPCLDLAALLPKDTSAFYDDCHFNAAGCARVAAALVPFLLEQIKN